MGDTIVMGINMNEYVRVSSLAKQLKDIVLKDVVLSKHPFKSPPATHNWNHSCEVIEGMITSLNVEVICAGFSSFDSNYPFEPSHKHCLIWAELDNFSILGKHIPVCNQPIEADRVKSWDPRSRKWYHKIAKRCFHLKNMFCMKENLEKQAYTFINGVTNTSKEIFIPKYIKKFNHFHLLVRKTKAAVAKKKKKWEIYLRVVNHGLLNTNNTSK